jgi:AAA ATPase domain/Cyclic nucleotide-binding domain
VARTDDPAGRSRTAPSSPAVVQRGTLIPGGEYWTIGYGDVCFTLRNVLGLTYLHFLLQNPGEEFHALDLLSGTSSSEVLEIDPSPVTRLREDDNVLAGRPGDIGPILDEQAKRDYRRRISELNEELTDLRERGNLNLLGERDYRRRAEVESELEALTSQLAQAVGVSGRDRRSGSAAERARLNVTRAIRVAIQKISEHNAQLGELLGNRIRTGSFCSYVPNARSSIEWKLAAGGVPPAPTTAGLVAISPPSEPSFVQPLRSRTAFVGREEERGLLRRYLQQARNSQGRIVIIAGPPGIGKTRLARETGEEARQQNFLAMAGNCYDREDSVPFVPFVELLEGLLARALKAAAVRQIFGEQAGEVARLLPQLRRLLPELPPPLQLSSEQSRRELFNAITDLIGRQSARNPLLLLLEDLHWADEGTLSLLIDLARSISRKPAMIIATHRNDDIDMKPPLTKALDELARLGVVERISLGGLPQPVVAQMIERLTREEPPAALVDRIYSNTDGNPLFIEELVGHLDRSRENGDSLEGLKQGEIVLPHSLRLLIGRRLALVSKEPKRILETAALIGRSFNFGLLEAATHAEPDRLVDSLEEAEKAGLISSRLEYPEARFKFAHELLRRAVLDEISVARRQRLHLQIAEAMELVYASSLEEHAEDLAHHFWSAGNAADPVKAIRYLRMAGEKAVCSSANVEAISHYRRALQLFNTLAQGSERLQQGLRLEIGLGTALALRISRQPAGGAGAEEFGGEILDELRQIDFLRHMGDQELHLLLPGVTLLKFAAGETIVSEGDTGDAMYIIRSGEVEVMTHATAGAHELHIRNLRRPAFFGEMALLTGKPRSATVRARTDIELLGLSRNGFLELFKSRPEAAAKIKEMIALRNNEMARVAGYRRVCT